MTVSSTTTRVEYTGNGATTTFDFAFRVITKDHLVVTVLNTTTGVATELTGSDFNVTTLPANSGTITYPLSGSPLSSSQKIVIKRIVPYTQGLDISNQEGFDAEVVEQSLDLLVMTDQQLLEEVNRAIRLAEVDAGIAELATSVNRAGKFLGFDSNGNLTLLNITGNTLIATPWRGEWVTATTYAINDLVSESGGAYICIEAHTSGVFATDLAANKWEVFATASGVLDINGLTALSAPATGDEVPVYDVSATANRKITLTDLWKIVDGFTGVSSPAIDDKLSLYDTSAMAPGAITTEDLFRMLNVLTAEAAPATNDRVAIYDFSATAPRRMVLSDLLKVVNALTAETTAAVGDEILLYDLSATAARKMTLKNALGVINALTETTSLDTANDLVPVYDASVNEVRKVKAQNFISSSQVMIVAHRVASGTGGPTFTAGSWVDFTLNSTVKNNISGASRSGNNLVLPAGTYRAKGYIRLRCATGERAAIRVIDNDTPITVAVGQSYNNPNGDDVLATVVLQDEFTLASTKNCRFQVWANSGNCGGAATTGELEEYGNLMLEKVG